jgi:hypothetical protein
VLEFETPFLGARGTIVHSAVVDALPTKASITDESDRDDHADTRFVRGLLIALGPGSLIWVTIAITILIR